MFHTPNRNDPSLGRLVTIKHGALDGLTGVLIARHALTLVLELAMLGDGVYLRVDARYCECADDVNACSPPHIRGHR